jgi:hypothetical protein
MARRGRRGGRRRKKTSAPDEEKEQQQEQPQQHQKPSSPSPAVVVSLGKNAAQEGADVAQFWLPEHSETPPKPAVYEESQCSQAIAEEWKMRYLEPPNAREGKKAFFSHNRLQQPWIESIVGQLALSLEKERGKEQEKEENGRVPLEVAREGQILQFDFSQVTVTESQPDGGTVSRGVLAEFSDGFVVLRAHITPECLKALQEDKHMPHDLSSLNQACVRLSAAEVGVVFPSGEPVLWIHQLEWIYQPASVLGSPERFRYVQNKKKGGAEDLSLNRLSSFVLTCLTFSLFTHSQQRHVAIWPRSRPRRSRVPTTAEKTNRKAGFCNSYSNRQASSRYS